jgi:RNA polymerase sigma-70 factor (ECF subfamily)
MSADDPIKGEAGIRGVLPLFEELFKLHHQRVYGVCLRMTRNAAESEDLSQEVFVQVFRKLYTFRGESNFKTWLHRLTINHVLMHFRKNRRRRREQTTEDGVLPEQVITSFSVLDRIALEEAIAKLAPGYRAVFILHDVEGLQHSEIASILGCSVGSTKSQLHKARLKLRGLLRERIHTNKVATVSRQIHKNLDRLRGVGSVGSVSSASSARNRSTGPNVLYSAL